MGHWQKLDNFPSRFEEVGNLEATKLSKHYHFPNLFANCHMSHWTSGHILGNCSQQESLELSRSQATYQKTIHLIPMLNFLYLVSAVTFLFLPLISFASFLFDQLDKVRRESGAYVPCAHTAFTSSKVSLPSVKARVLARLGHMGCSGGKVHTKASYLQWMHMGTLSSAW